MTPKSWREMVVRTRELELALGTRTKKIEQNEKETVVVQRRCLRASKALSSGHCLTRNDLVSLRPCPADGIEPYKIEDVIGSVLNRDIEFGEQIKFSHINLNQ